MHKLTRTRASLLLLAVSAVLSLTGCGAAKMKVAPAASATVTPPAFTVPEHFASVEEKQAFAVQAVDSGHYAEAAPLLEEVVSTAPTARAYQKLGTAKYNLGDHTSAIAAWNKAADLDNEVSGEMLNNAGNALRDSGKIADAEAAYRKALEIEPTRWTAATNLAMLLKQQNKLDESIAILEKALLSNKDVPPVVSLLDSLKSEAATPAKGG